LRRKVRRLGLRDQHGRRVQDKGTYFFLNSSKLKRSSYIHHRVDKKATSKLPISPSYPSSCSRYSSQIPKLFAGAALQWFTPCPTRAIKVTHIPPTVLTQPFRAAIPFPDQYVVDPVIPTSTPYPTPKVSIIKIGIHVMRNLVAISKKGSKATKDQILKIMSIMSRNGGSLLYAAPIDLNTFRRCCWSRC